MEDAYKKAKLSAVRLLGFRSQSVAEMQQKLTRQGFDPATVQRVVEELRRTGYLNDERFAREFIRYQLQRKPVGRFLLTGKLKEHGISEETARRVMDSEYSPDREKELAREVAEEKKGELLVKLSRVSPLQKRKIGQYLSARGFSAEVVWEVVEHLDKGKNDW